MQKLRLGVNIDHVATVRQARGGSHPSPLRAAMMAAAAGADGITAHLREDRRHISDHDIESLRLELRIPLNLEMAATPEMKDIALKHLPHACCIVPENRQERTTEGGIDAAGQFDRLKPIVRELVDAGIRVSMFIEPDKRQLDASRALPWWSFTPVLIRTPPARHRPNSSRSASMQRRTATRSASKSMPVTA
jgi:pyridoxine 5-phosphate synthase